MLDVLKKLKLTNRKVIQNDSFVKAIDYDGQGNLAVVVALKLQILDAGLLTLKREFAVSNPTVDNALTGIRYLNHNTLISSSADGYIRVWDDRVEDPTLVLPSTLQPEAEGELKPLLCCDVSLDQCTVAAGSEAVKEDAFVLFWDVRNSKQLMGGYWDSHSKDISQVRFHPRDKFLLATGGIDGLVNVFDLEEASEDDAIQYTLNTECAVNHLSWLSPTAQKVDRLGVTTTEEEFQLWEADEAEPSVKQSRDCLQKDNVEVAIDHIVCSYGVGSDAGFVTSANEGYVDLWSAQGVHITSLRPATEKKSSGHRDLVRCTVIHENNGRYTIWTSGDDGIVCRWVTESKSAVPEQTSGRKALSEQKSKVKSKRSKPY